jgi:hypothetical protein
VNASEQIDKQIAELKDWRGELLTELRKAINEADPRLSEDWKWGNAVWTCSGNVCSTAAFKDHVKINFFKGAHLPDPHKMFNAGLEAKESRSVDLQRGQAIDFSAIQELVRNAVEFNQGNAKRKS